MPKSKELSSMDLVLRFVGPLLLVLITYNPSGISFYHWFTGSLSGDGLSGIHFLALVILVIGWSILLIATFNALDMFGMILAAALLGTTVWVFIDFGLLSVDSASVITWIVLVCISLLLTIGLSWAHLWRRMTGQLTVDDIDD